MNPIDFCKPEWRFDEKEKRLCVFLTIAQRNALRLGGNPRDHSPDAIWGRETEKELAALRDRFGN